MGVRPYPALAHHMLGIQTMRAGNYRSSTGTATGRQQEHDVITLEIVIVRAPTL